MLKAKYGRVVVTASVAGLFGLPTQAGYGAAKAAMIGLCRVLAIEGRRRNIGVNVIAPMAVSRLTSTESYTDRKQEAASDDSPAGDPRYVAALVTFLCHESCKANGSIYEAGMGWYCKTELVRSRGYVLEGPALRDPSLASPEVVGAAFADIEDFKAEGSTTPGIRYTNPPKAAFVKILEQRKASKL